MAWHSRLVATLSRVGRKLVKRHIYDVQYGSITVRREGGFGFLRKPNSCEVDFLCSRELGGKIVYDIGGYVGLLSVFFSRSVGPTGSVIVFEPNRDNCQKILRHVELNQCSNVRLISVGVSDTKNSRCELVVGNSDATGTLNPQIQRTIVGQGDYKVRAVEVDTLDNMVLRLGLPFPDFIKIDIEGVEYAALVGMRELLERLRPDLYIEMHGADDRAKRENARAVMMVLSSLGYSAFHVERAQTVRLDNCELARDGHIFCTAS